MIKPNELRIGNYVNNGKKIVKIKLINFCDSYKYWHIFHNLGYSSSDLNDCKPIPLTEEILLNCGFYWDKKKVYLCLNETAFRIRYSSNQLTLFQPIQYLTIPDIKHLHQLQNIYFALTQKELEINFNN